jgi:putative protease
VPDPNLDKPELLSPAGDWDCLRAAVASGADAVYFGMPRFNARMRAENFQEGDLPKIVAFTHRHGVKAYVALNVLIFPAELDDAVAELRALNDAGIDAVIIQDVGLAEISRRMFPALRVHASTQMTVTSPEGVRFAEELGAKQVVLSRELSLRELAKFEPSVPLEVFVHGALCVAYSGQCLTSESLGQRSANRGECAQACRMPYEMIVDGQKRDLGDKRYLLSPQDLAAVREIPELIRLGVKSFKIEGRLKTPEYVAAVTSVYRKAIDAALAGRAGETSREDWYKLEMTFSRGLFSGWMHGVDHQRLVNATYGKKRGVPVGTVSAAGRDWVEVKSSAPLKAGEGVVFENPSDTNNEQGGRIYEVRGNRLLFERGRLDCAKIASGTRVWKTSDPAVEREIKKAWQSRIEAGDTRKRPLALTFSGRPGEPLLLEAEGLRLGSVSPLQTAQKAGLNETALAEIFSRLNDTPYRLADLSVRFEGGVFLPRSELNQLKHELVAALEARDAARRKPSGVTVQEAVEEMLSPFPPSASPLPLSLPVLCRTTEQIEAALRCGIRTIYADFEDIRRYKDAVALVRGRAEIFLATPRIQKAGEQGFFKLIEAAGPDGVLIRNVGAISYFRDSSLRRIGDFSLNVANAASAAVFLARGLERVTISYDLNIGQVLDLLGSAPPKWFELTLHQHMPMFHMEHCAFAAFLSTGSSFLDCGRPCEKHRVHLRDRVGIPHPLRADVGCRNTLFNAAAQTGAAHFDELCEAGLRHFRIELLEETARETETILHAYQSLLAGDSTGDRLWRSLKAQSQLGVTKGTLVGGR